jgi:hypothetical protein
VLFAFSRTTCLKVFSFVIFDPIQCRKWKRKLLGETE